VGEGLNSAGPGALGAAGAAGSPGPDGSIGSGRSTDALQVTVNGAARELPAGTTIAALLDALAVRTDRCAVEVNRESVPRSTHAAHALRKGDAVEIVTFVGGG
jgi:sulfur carrier protein